MSYKIIELKGRNTQTSYTELLFEIASAKAGGIKLIRFNIKAAVNEAEAKDVKKMISSLIKTLKQMKSKGQIQLFATPTSFEKTTTEAVFILNKHPYVISEIKPDESLEFFFYIII